MNIQYDKAKCSRNITERGLSFDRVTDFDFATAIVYADWRKPYAETRYIAIGYLDYRLHVLVFTETTDGIRVISFRKANKREGQHHGLALTKN